MTEVLLAAPRAQRSSRRCGHHWVIESPDGPTSRGRCKLCGAVKEFSNYLPYTSWAEEKAAKSKRSRNRGQEEGERIANL
jgi:hypothetical protein